MNQEEKCYSKSDTISPTQARQPTSHSADRMHSRNKSIQNMQ